MRPGRSPRLAPLALALALLGVALVPAGSSAAPKSQTGVLTQLSGKNGCLVNGGTKKRSGCGSARALDGPGAFMGSRALVVSPDGRHLYVTATKSDSIAIFSRDKKTGTLSQAKGSAGCVAAKAAYGCAPALGPIEPNSVAISPDGKNVYATSRAGSSVTSFCRNPKTGALRQLPPTSSGCISGLALPGCTLGRALVTPDVIVVSPDGMNVYAGSFFGNAVVAFGRAPSGALTQLAGSAGCIAEATEGCASAVALNSIEGLAISGDGISVYAAAATSNAVAELSRNPETGALSQVGCIVDGALKGCASGREIAGANAVAISPSDGSVYVTSLLSNSVTAFDRDTSTGLLAQKEATNACLVFLRATGCSFGRALDAPEGLVVSPDGKNVYVASVETGAIDVLNRNVETGAVRQRQGTTGCLAAPSVKGCTPARATAGASSVAISPDGRYVYATALESNAVDVFRRQK